MMQLNLGVLPGDALVVQMEQDPLGGIRVDQQPNTIERPVTVHQGAGQARRERGEIAHGLECEAPLSLEHQQLLRLKQLAIIRNGAIDLLAREVQLAQTDATVLRGARKSVLEAVPVVDHAAGHFVEQLAQRGLLQGTLQKSS